MKPITRVKCIWPFTKLTVHHHGYCFSCCRSWSKLGNVGRLNPDNSIMEIWNNERMQYIRKAVLDDQLSKVCNFKSCPIAMNNEYLYLESMRNDDPNFNYIIDQILAGKTILDKPPYIFEVANSGLCNLKCTMCQSNDKFLNYDDDSLDERLFNKILPDILPEISYLSLTANGEVFFNPYSRKFLQSSNSNQYPGLKIQLVTNGTLLTPKLWETIKANRFDSIFISVDAASKETYEKIRQNGNWEILRRNLDFISELRRQNFFTHFRITFIVMQSNYLEMKEFVKLGLQLGCDKILFQKIFGIADLRENINLIKNKKVLVEIGRTLTDPIFGRPEVDTTLIDEYRKYSGQTVSFWSDLVAKGKGRLLYLPVKAMMGLAKYFSFLYVIDEFLKQKRIPAQRSKM